MPERSSVLETPIRVGLLIPSAAVRVGLRTLLGADERLEVVLEASSLAGLTRAPENDADVLILTPASARGFDYSREMQPYAQIGVLWLTDENLSEQFDPPRLPGQPCGVLPLDVDAKSMAIAIRALSEGLSVSLPDWLTKHDRGVNREIGPAREGREGLTPREIDVLQQLALGLTNKQIALALGISEHTAKYHISSIYSKLGVMNRAEAVSVGVRQGWISL